MPLIINKTLKGLIVQDQEAQYNYALPETGINSVQNALTSANFEEVFIDCYTDEGSQKIRLPKISLFRRGFSPKIYVYNKGVNLVGILAIVSVTEINTINYSSALVLEKGQSGYLHITNNNNWACWVSPMSF